ncbi:hypothetical protein HAX54_046696, partial [Datura stramonium]|nr:hypothetical protein [Datura stramonium]
MVLVNDKEKTPERGNKDSPSLNSSGHDNVDALFEEDEFIDPEALRDKNVKASERVLNTQIQVIL